MRIALRVGIAVGVFGMTAGIACPALADPPAAPPAAAKGEVKGEIKGEIEVWDGYVWKDAEGHVRLGDPVVAMGVAGGPAQVIAGPLAKSLEPWLTPAKSEFIFWNYTLESTDEKALSSLPKALVRVRGHVVEEGVTYLSSGEGTRTMTDARLRSIEWVDREWLVTWSLFFREKASPWRIREDTDISDAGHRAFAPKALAALVAMRARPHPDEAATKRAKAIDPDAAAGERFRQETEVSIQRWLVEEDERLGWKLPGLADLPPVPPSGERIQSIFLKMPTRAAFLEALKALTTVDFASIDVPHYRAYKTQAVEGTTWASATAEQIRDDWTDEEYAARRKATLAIMKR